MLAVTPDTDAWRLLERVVQHEEAETVELHAEALGLPIERVQSLAAELARLGLLLPRCYQLARHVQARIAQGGEAPRGRHLSDPADDILVELTLHGRIERVELARRVECLGKDKKPTSQFKRAAQLLSETCGQISTPSELWASEAGEALLLTLWSPP